MSESQYYMPPSYRDRDRDRGWNRERNREIDRNRDTGRDRSRDDESLRNWDRERDREDRDKTKERNQSRETISRPRERYSLSPPPPSLPSSIPKAVPPPLIPTAAIKRETWRPLKASTSTLPVGSSASSSSSFVKSSAQLAHKEPLSGSKMREEYTRPKNAWSDRRSISPDGGPSTGERNKSSGKRNGSESYYQPPTSSSRPSPPPNISCHSSSQPRRESGKDTGDVRNSNESDGYRDTERERAGKRAIEEQVRGDEEENKWTFMKEPNKASRDRGVRKDEGRRNRRDRDRKDRRSSPEDGSSSRLRYSRSPSPDLPKRRNKSPNYPRKRVRYSFSPSPTPSTSRSPSSPPSIQSRSPSPSPLSTSRKPLSRGEGHRVSRSPSPDSSRSPISRGRSLSFSSSRSRTPSPRRWVSSNRNKGRDSNDWPTDDRDRKGNESGRRKKWSRSPSPVHRATGVKKQFGTKRSLSPIPPQGPRSKSGREGGKDDEQGWDRGGSGGRRQDDGWEYRDTDRDRGRERGRESFTDRARDREREREKERSQYNRTNDQYRRMRNRWRPPSPPPVKMRQWGKPSSPSPKRDTDSGDTVTQGTNGHARPYGSPDRPTTSRRNDRSTVPTSTKEIHSTGVDVSETEKPTSPVDHNGSRVRIDVANLSPTKGGWKLISTRTVLNSVLPGDEMEEGGSEHIYGGEKGKYRDDDHMEIDMSRDRRRPPTSPGRRSNTTGQALPNSRAPIPTLQSPSYPSSEQPQSSAERNYTTILASAPPYIQSAFKQWFDLYGSTNSNGAGLAAWLDQYLGRRASGNEIDLIQEVRRGRIAWESEKMGQRNGSGGGVRGRHRNGKVGWDRDGPGGGGVGRGMIGRGSVPTAPAEMRRQEASRSTSPVKSGAKLPAPTISSTSWRRLSGQSDLHEETQDHDQLEPSQINSHPSSVPSQSHIEGDNHTNTNLPDAISSTTLEMVPLPLPSSTHRPPPSSVLSTAPTQGEAYERLAQVGQGTYGKVYKARQVISGALVALKRIRMEGEKDGFPVTAMREIKLLQNLRHPNVVRLHEMMVSKGSVYMVMEYMTHDLTGVLAHPEISLSPANIKSLSFQMLSGLAFLHARGILHRDMKGSNILLSGSGELKLADFGLARFYHRHRNTYRKETSGGSGNNKREDYTNRVITLWYRSPELLLGETAYGPEVDIWSAGCIVLELFTSKPVFQGFDEINQLEVIWNIMGTPVESANTNTDTAMIEEGESVTGVKDDQASAIKAKEEHEGETNLWPNVVDLPWYELVKPKTAIPNRFRSNFKKWLTLKALDLVQGLLAMDPSKRLSAVEALKSDYFMAEKPEMEPPVHLATSGEHHEMTVKIERQKRRNEAK